jgi:hypothetical protein
MGLSKALGLILLSASALWADKKVQDFSDFTMPLPMERGHTLVLGIVGGWESWANDSHVVRGVVMRIRNRKLPGVWAETVENHSLDLGRVLIRKALDRNGDGVLQPDETADARLIIYGQSLGASATLRLARDLESWGVPVLLTIQIDSVGRDDTVVPANVRAAANLYQRDWVLRGEEKIRAADPSKTRIIGNFRYKYRGKDGRRVPYPKEETTLRKIFLNRHLEMQYDPAVWDHVERLILEAIGPVSDTRVAGRPDAEP